MGPEIEQFTHGWDEPVKQTGAEPGAQVKQHNVIRITLAGNPSSPTGNTL